MLQPTLLSALLLTAPPGAPARATPAVAPSADLAAPSPAGGGATTPTTPAPVTRVLALRPFTLDEGYESDWRAERPMVRSGWLMAIEAAPALARQRQTASPVLYVGDEVAERLNGGGPASADAEGGPVRLIVVVPAPIGDDGAVVQPLAEAPAYFGSPMLPEQVDAHFALAELAAAKAAGISPPSKAELAEARVRGGGALHTGDRAALLVVAAGWLRTWSPTEIDQADLLEGKPVTSTSAPEEPASPTANPK